MRKTVVLEARIAALPCWKGKVVLEPLRGGLSNASFVVHDGGERFVARCGSDVPAHHVIRDRERAASIAAHAAGLSPEVIHAESGIMIIRHIAGKTYDEADMRANLARIAPLIAICHREVARHVTGPANAFWVFHVIRDYVRTLKAETRRPRADLARYAALANALEARQVPLPVVFGHHDLLPGNFLDDGERIWIIDWEYGGFGTCMFDLANIAANGRFSPADERHLLEAYFGKSVGSEMQCSFDAMKVASTLREALWAMISEIRLDAPGADYRSHAADYLGRTESALSDFAGRHGSLVL